MAIFGAENPTSYFSAPSETLDPTLFEGRSLRSWVRQGITSLLHDFLQHSFRHSELWAHAWLAGSGVSYQWSAARQPGDLDCLVGVDYAQFRKANPEFRGLSDREISAHINELFSSGLQPKTANWNGYELTFYVNPGATDIRAIKPYAAYDLKYDEWTVSPSPLATAPVNPAWDASADADATLAKQLQTRFTSAQNDLQLSRNDAMRRNAETRAQGVLAQAVSLYDEIHHGRRTAFSMSGEGYGDFHNYRWQAAKRLGTVDTLRTLKNYAESQKSSYSASTYGVELPTSDTLIRRAALHRYQ